MSYPTLIAVAGTELENDDVAVIRFDPSVHIHICTIYLVAVFITVLVPRSLLLRLPAAHSCCHEF